MLKEIRLQGTEVSKISISGDSCPFLETLCLISNEYLRDLETLPAALKTIEVLHCNVLKDIRGVRGLKNLRKLEIWDCEELDELPSLAEFTSLKAFKLYYCNKLEKIEGLESLRSLEELNIGGCRGLEALPNLSEITYLKEIQLHGCHKLKKIEGLQGLRSLDTLEISDCPELDRLPSLQELTYLQRIVLRNCHKLEKIEGLERLRSLVKLEVHSCWNVPCIVNLEKCERLESLLVVTHDSSDVEAYISNIQKWPRNVIICSQTRAVFHVGSLKSFFQELPNVSLLDYSVQVYEIGGPRSHSELRRPESSAGANAILICFIIDCVYPDLNLHIFEGRTSNYFRTELGRGKWVWMGAFTEGSCWLLSDRHSIYGYERGNDSTVIVKVEEAWSVMGEEGSIVKAFQHLFQSNAR